jgi:hypothetical protein
MSTRPLLFVLPLLLAPVAGAGAQPAEAWSRDTKG